MPADPLNVIRPQVLSRLRSVPGSQFVIVHFSSDHNAELNECAFNRAQSNSAKVNRADDMGPAKNEQLIHYFKHRHVWLLYADTHRPELVPYPDAAGAESRAGQR